MECPHNPQALEHATIVLANVLTTQVALLGDAAAIGPSCADFIRHAGDLPELNWGQMQDLARELDSLIGRLDDVRQMLVLHDSYGLERWQESCRIK